MVAPCRALPDTGDPTGPPDGGGGVGRASAGDAVIVGSARAWCLFDATQQLHIDRLLDAVPFDPYNLPGYVAALFDFGVTHPELLRLLHWHTLERPGELARFEQTVGSTQRKLAALAEAQAAGKVDARLEPGELLAVVLGIVRAIDDLEPATVAIRRDTVSAAVRRLVTP